MYNSHHQGCYDNLESFDWDSFVTRLLNAKTRFKVVVCICDYNSFKNLFSIVCKSMYVTKMWLEFGQYMAWQEEVPSLSTNLMSNVFFFSYVYLFPCKIGANVGINILGNKKLMALIRNLIFLFLKDEKFYENEVCLEVTFQIIKLILVDMIVYLNIFGGRIFTPTCLVSAITRWWHFIWKFFNR
jgi:hypothetical protein